MSYKIEIEPHLGPMDPREWDNLATMVCWHRRYNLGDEQPEEDPEEYLTGLLDQETRKQLERLEYLINEIPCHLTDQYEWVPNKTHWKRYKWLKKLYFKVKDEALEKQFVIMPLYLYDHSGITISCGPFSCPWDSGQAGFAYVSMETGRKEFPSLSDEELKKQLEKNIRGEVKTYDMFLRGEVYGYTIEDEEGEYVDSCWGYYGYEEAEKAAEAVVNHLTEEKASG